MRSKKSHFVDNYATVKAETQKKADATGYDYQIVKTSFGYQACLLPRAENRFGRDREGEVVHCTYIDRCQPGHGPTARVR